MKVKLSIGQKPWSGYLNIDPNPVLEPEFENQFEVYAGDFKFLDELVENSDCTEILVENCLDYIAIDHIIDVINHWVSKLRHNGKIILKGVNLESLIKKYFNGEITTLDFNHHIYGNQDQVWNHKSGCVNLEEICDILCKAGLKIISKRLDNIEFIIIAQRP